MKDCWRVIWSFGSVNTEKVVVTAWNPFNTYISFRCIYSLPLRFLVMVVGPSPVISISSVYLFIVVCVVFGTSSWWWCSLEIHSFSMLSWWFSFSMLRHQRSWVQATRLAKFDATLIFWCVLIVFVPLDTI